MSDGNGQAVPMVGGMPLASQAVPWGWQVHQVGRDDNTGEKVFILRLALPTGPLDLWAPASFLKDLGEKLVAAGAGLHIAGEMPPP